MFKWLGALEITREMETGRVQVVLGFWKFFLGTILLGSITFFVSASLKEREMLLKERESERLEIELIGRYIQFALADNVATRERFARYFWRLSRSEEAKRGWADYLSDVMQEKASVESERTLLEAQRKELERLAASDRAKAEELKEVKQKLREVMDQLEVRKPVVVSGGTFQGHGAGLGGAATAQASGNAALSISSDLPR